MNIIEWEPYNFGECTLEFYSIGGELFSGRQEDFYKEHKTLFGLKNKTTGMVVLINHFGQIAAKTPMSPESEIDVPKVTMVITDCVSEEIPPRSER